MKTTTRKIITSHRVAQQPLAKGRRPGGRVDLRRLPSQMLIVSEEKCPLMACPPSWLVDCRHLVNIADAILRI